MFPLPFSPVLSLISQGPSHEPFHQKTFQIPANRKDSFSPPTPQTTLIVKWYIFLSFTLAANNRIL